MSVDDIASQSSVIFKPVYSITKRTQFPGFINVSPGSVETLVRRGGITSHHLLIHTLSATSLPKNYQNRLMCSEVVVCNSSVVFFRRHSVHEYLFLILWLKLPQCIDCASKLSK